MDVYIEEAEVLPRNPPLFFFRNPETNERLRFGGLVTYWFNKAEINSVAKKNGFNVLENNKNKEVTRNDESGTRDGNNGK